MFGFPSFRMSVLPSPYSSMYLMCATPPTVLFRFFLKLYRCLYHALKICISFGYNPKTIFFPHFSQFELSHFGHFYNGSEMDSGYLVCATPPTVFYFDSFETLQIS